MTKKHTLILLVGVPCSGKSTFTKKLHKHFVLSTDDKIDAATVEGEAYSEAFNRLQRLGSLKHFEREMFDEAASINRSATELKSTTVVWDQTNLTKATRQKKLSYFPAEKWERVCLYFPVDIHSKEYKETTQKRLDDTGKEIPHHIIENMFSSIEEPTKDEGFDSVNVIYRSN